MERNWTVKDVSSQFKEAISTLKKLPPVRSRGYFNNWPELLGMKEETPADETAPLRFSATSDDIYRMEQAFKWITWLGVEERKLIGCRAASQGWKIICWEMGYNRTTAWRKWSAALAKVAARLNAGCR